MVDPKIKIEAQKAIKEAEDIQKFVAYVSDQNKRVEKEIEFSEILKLDETIGLEAGTILEIEAEISKLKGTISEMEEIRNEKEKEEEQAQTPQEEPKNTPSKETKKKREKTKKDRKNVRSKTKKVVEEGAEIARTFDGMKGHLVEKRNLVSKNVRLCQAIRTELSSRLDNPQELRNAFDEMLRKVPKRRELKKITSKTPGGVVRNFLKGFDIPEPTVTINQKPVKLKKEHLAEYILILKDNPDSDPAIIYWMSKKRERIGGILDEIQQEIEGIEMHNERLKDLLKRDGVEVKHNLDSIQGLRGKDLGEMHQDLVNIWDHINNSYPQKDYGPIKQRVLEDVKRMDTLARDSNVTLYSFATKMYRAYEEMREMAGAFNAEVKAIRDELSAIEGIKQNLKDISSLEVSNDLKELEESARKISDNLVHEERLCVQIEHVIILADQHLKTEVTNQQGETDSLFGHLEALLRDKLEPSHADVKNINRRILRILERVKKEAHIIEDESRFAYNYLIHNQFQNEIGKVIPTYVNTMNKIIRSLKTLHDGVLVKGLEDMVKSLPPVVKGKQREVKWVWEDYMEFLSHLMAAPKWATAYEKWTNNAGGSITNHDLMNDLHALHLISSAVLRYGEFLNKEIDKRKLQDSIDK